MDISQSTAVNKPPSSGFPSQSVAANKRLAVVIGNSEYNHLKPLKNATNDARAVKDQLQKLGYDASMKLNLTYKQTLAYLREKLDIWKHDASEIVLFYAGHGVAIGKLHR